MIPYLSNYKEELNEYVQNGGSLILFSQNQNKKTRYDFLPVAITFNQGNYDTIGISKEHAITSNLFPYEVAGSFYSSMGTILEPYYDTPGAEILIRETPYGPYKNNNPSLVLSTWGAGKIIATTIHIDKKSVIDTNTTVCKWWDPDTLGQGHDWHFRRLVIIDAGNVTRVNEPVEVIIDPTAEINKLAKDRVDTYKNIQDINIHGNIKEYFSLKSKILNYCEENSSLFVYAYSDGQFYVNIGKIRAHVYTDKINKLRKSDFYTFVPNDRKVETEKKQQYFGFKEYNEAENFLAYIRTKFARFCLSIFKIDSHLESGQLKSVPWLDFSYKWTDEKIYEYFELSEEEIQFIEGFIPEY